VNSRRAFVVWGVAVLAYVLAVMQRSSLGVSGVDAQDRFAVTAAVLSTLAVVQIAVYAGLQIPVGIALDRVGPRRLVLLGALLLTVGQAVVALSPTIGPAIVGRVLVGAGDAMTFISVMRLLPMWFSGTLLPQISQWTGNLGQIGQIVSAFPFALLLHTVGWDAAFGVAAIASAVGLVLAVVFVRAGPVVVRTDTIPIPHSWSAAFGTFGHALRRPGTQLGFWSHYVTQSSGTVFSLLWGVPMLRGLGYSPTEAATFLTVIVVVGFVAGPVLGLLCARFPMRRSNLVIGIVMALGVVWTAVLLWPGQPPTWLLVRVAHRLRLRPLVQPGGFARLGERRRERRRVPGGVRDDVRDRVAPRRPVVGIGHTHVRLAELPCRDDGAVRRGRVRGRDAPDRTSPDPRSAARRGRNTGGSALGCTRCTPAERARAIMITDPFGSPASDVGGLDMGPSAARNGRTRRRGGLRRWPWVAREGHDPRNVARRGR
jgi:nitrate/nitrite transporter NarK